MESVIVSDTTPIDDDKKLKRAMLRGALGRCPSCGETPLFRAYLKQVAACPACDAEFARIRSDDAAPWLTIILVGHIFLPLIFYIDLAAFMPVWATVAVWGAVFCSLSLILLPRTKGFFIGFLWASRAPGVDAG